LEACYQLEFVHCKWLGILENETLILASEAFGKMLIGIGILFFEMPFLFIIFSRNINEYHENYFLKGYANMT